MAIAVECGVKRTLFESIAGTSNGRPGRDTDSVTAKRAGKSTLLEPVNTAAKVSVRSVFEVGTAPSRLAIGHFNRPLLTEEVASLKRAYERARLPEVVDFEVTPKQVAFLSPAPQVASTWSSIESLLANPSLAKAS
jgi:hypothetical protein